MSGTTLIVAADLASALPDVPPSALAALPARVTAAVEGYCQRPLALASRDEEYEPGLSRIIHLKGYPVVSIAQVLVDLVDVLAIQSSAGPWRASVALQFSADPTVFTPTGLTLASTTAGVASTTPLTFSPSYPTVAQLATAIAGTGSWSAVVTPNLGACPTAELRPVKGAYEALAVPAKLQAYITTADRYELVARNGKLTLFGVRADAYRYPTQTWGILGNSSKARAIYQAGYQGDPNQGTVTTPPDLAEACVQTARAILDCRSVSGVLHELNLGNTTITAGDIDAIPPGARRLLSKYVDRRF